MRRSTSLTCVIFFDEVMETVCLNGHLFEGRCWRSTAIIRRTVECVLVLLQKDVHRRLELIIIGVTGSIAACSCVCVILFLLMTFLCEDGYFNMGVTPSQFVAVVLGLFLPGA